MNYKFPQYRRGEIAVFSSKPAYSRNDYNDGFLKEIAKVFNCEYLGRVVGIYLKFQRERKRNTARCLLKNTLNFLEDMKELMLG